MAKEAGTKDERAAPAGGKDKAFRGKWPLPEGARPVKPGKREPVDDASDGSFPASDPPPFSPTRTG
jgi:hypothetical protein